MWGLKKNIWNTNLFRSRILVKILVTFMSDIDSPKGKGNKSLNQHLIVQL